jgi:hypothetical protein
MSTRRRVMITLLALVWLLQGLGLVTHPLSHLARASDVGAVSSGLTSPSPDQPPADQHCATCLAGAHAGDLLLYTPVLVVLQLLLATAILTRMRGIRVPTVVHSLSRAPPAPFPVV